MPPKSVSAVSATAAKKAAYQKRWLSGKPSKDEQDKDLEEKLRAGFWGHKDADPRCYTCRVQNAKMPAEGDEIDGTEEIEKLPCGCNYKESILELWCAKKGLWEGNSDLDKNERMPKAFGRHRSCLLSFFEILFGTFSVEKMLNIDGARVAALKKVSKIESKGGLQLAPHEFPEDSESD